MGAQEMYLDIFTASQAWTYSTFANSTQTSGRNWIGNARSPQKSPIMDPSIIASCLSGPDGDGDPEDEGDTADEDADEGEGEESDTAEPDPEVLPALEDGMPEDPKLKS